MSKRLKDFMEMCGEWELIHVIIWDPDYREDSDEPIFKGWLSDVPYWIAKRKLAKFGPHDDFSAIAFADDLGDGRAGLVITLESEEKKKKKKKRKKK